ncbi:unnamed protein product [Boreogadus saida]
MAALVQATGDGTAGSAGASGPGPGYRGLTLLAPESLLKEAVEGCHVHHPGVLCGIISHWNTSLGSVRFLIFFFLWPRHTPG